MKKIVLTIVAMLTMTMAFAENEKAVAVDNAQNYNMQVNYRSLAVALGLNDDQMDGVKNIYKNFCTEMMNASQAPKDEQKKMVNEAVAKQRKYMGYILDDEQFRKFCNLIDVTLQNRGLK